MKKFLAIILVLMLAFSMLLITACNKDNNTADTETSSIPEESSSGRNRGEGAGSNITPTPGTTTSGDDRPPSSSTLPPDGGSDNPPQATEYEYGEYDYTYQTIPIKPNDTTTKAGKFDQLIYAFYSQDYSKPELSDDFYDALVGNEDRYNELSETDKGAVQNYKFLQEARKAYNDMAKKECEKLISALPDASTDNIEEFSILSNAIQKLINNLGTEADNVSNKGVYEQKIAQVDSIFIETFKQKVAEVKTFEYTLDYKAKLDSAVEFYNGLSASQKSVVHSFYQELSDLLVKYEDTGVVNKFNEIYNKLPAPSAVTKEDKTNIEQAKTMYLNMSNTQLQLLGDNKAILDKLNDLETEINKICPIYFWAGSIDGLSPKTKTMSFDNNITSVTFDFSGLSTTSARSGFTYQGKSLEIGFSCSNTFKIKGVPYGGKIVIYALEHDNIGKTRNVTVSGGSHTETKPLVVPEPLEFYVPTGGDYTVSFSGKVKIFAVEFS